MNISSNINSSQRKIQSKSNKLQFCTQCYKKNSEENEFCENCGVKLTLQIKNKNQVENQNDISQIQDSSFDKLQKVKEQVKVDSYDRQLQQQNEQFQQEEQTILNDFQNNEYSDLRVKIINKQEQNDKNLNQQDQIKKNATKKPNTDNFNQQFKVQQRIQVTEDQDISYLNDNNINSLQQHQEQKQKQERPEQQEQTLRPQQDSVRQKENNINLIDEQTKQPLKEKQPDLEQPSLTRIPIYVQEQEIILNKQNSQQQLNISTENKNSQNQQQFGQCMQCSEKAIGQCLAKENISFCILNMSCGKYLCEKHFGNSSHNFVKQQICVPSEEDLYASNLIKCTQSKYNGGELCKNLIQQEIEVQIQYKHTICLNCRNNLEKKGKRIYLFAFIALLLVISAIIVPIIIFYG